MIPLQQFMPDALAAILRKAPLTPEKVDFAWRSAVGGAVAQVLLELSSAESGSAHIWESSVRFLRRNPTISNRFEACQNACPR